MKQPEFGTHKNVNIRKMIFTKSDCLINWKDLEDIT